MLFCRSTLPGAPTALLLLSLMGPTAAAFQSAAPELHVAFEKHVLPNGLQVVIHEDHAAPVVAVYVSYHVGSAREEIGRSGFAHLFEHMLFQGSEHVGDDQHFKLVSEAGGTLNGTTNLDRTLYFETLPSNQLELALWLESDRMGFLLPAMTQEKLDNQREVVRNERRQNYENRPYGQASAAIAAALFPTGHPYSWLTIGSHEDLEAATLEDVSAFFERWYGPNNATLAIGGDVDPAEALALAEKWFGGLPRGPEVPTMAARPAALERDVRIVLEDRVRLPRLIMTWPSAEQHTPDSLALELLAMVLSENKSSVLDRALTVDELLAREVFVSNQAAELAGRFAITATAAPGVELGTLEARIRELLANLAAEGIAPEVLERMKSRFEADFVRSLETVSGRTARLAVSNTFTGDPDHFLVEMRRTLELEPAEVQAALEQYLVGRPAVVASVVPEGQRDLAAPAPPETPLAAAAKVDRDARPGPGPAPAFHTPPIWHDRLENGVTVTGTPFAAAPITTLELCVPGGRSHESMETLGISTLVAALMAEGTRELSTTELTDELDLLGASLRIRADDDEIAITLTALDRNLERAAELLADIVLEPRFEAADFERLKQQRLTAIDARSDNIRLIASDVWNRLNRGDESVLGRPSLGTRETIEALTRDDVLAFHRRAVVPAGARLLVVGDLDAERTRELTRRLASEWSGGAAAAEPVEAAAGTEPELPTGRVVYLVDKPGAAQSELRIGHPSVSTLDPDWYPLQVLNYVLGGNFSSRINMNLREDKGYTYGARSYFAGGLRPGTFTASAGVHTEVTVEAIRELLAELEGILSGVTEEELAFADNAQRQALLRRYESSRALLSLVDDVSRHGWADDFPEQRLAVLQALTTEELASLARRHVFPGVVRVLVVGDREKVAEPLNELGLEVVELDDQGVPLDG